ncbi:E3 SUMO-protein ligase pli1-like [Papaver somniferum]|uniref:E3 SUMO-protein ligase pli1-like n=1 Tax=Papaver somniferum TaxID=3469 RepID=UPI000E700732|nr:E3 SUMO-protein ligase pli1-like [Papaver somniferum]
MQFSHSRITHSARFKQSGHLLDLIKFLQYAQASKKLVKWECPVCRKRYSFTDLISDGYLMPILAALPEEVNEIEVQHDASWRLIGRTTWNKPEPPYVIDQEEVGGEDGVVHIPSDDETQGVASASVAPACTASTSTASTSETKDVNPLDDSLKVLESQYVASTGGGGVVHVSSAEEIRDVAAASVASASVGSTSETRDVRPPDDSLKLLGRQYGGDSDSD